MNFHGHNGPRDHPPTKPPPPGSHHPPHHHHHHQKNHHHHQQPPIPHPHPDPANRPPEKWHSYKMLVDPSIHRGAPKMIRYDGTTVPGNPHHVSFTPSDPRTKLPSALWRRLEAMDLPVPKFKIDENFVGEPPKVEVTVENMNDNVDKQFLLRMIEKCGVVEDVKIYFHPVSGKHLGLAHLCFEEVKGARECVKYLHGKSVMGQQLNCYLDPMSKSCQMMFAELTEEKKIPEPQPLLPPVPTVPNQNQPSKSEQDHMDQYQPMLEEDNISPGENHDWQSHHHQQQHEPYPYQRRESREDPRRPSQDPRRPSQDHERRHSRDYRESSHNKYTDQNDQDTEMQAYEPMTTSLAPLNQDDSKYQQTPFDPNYWQQEAQKYAAAAATAAGGLPHQPTPPPSSTNLDMSFEAPNVIKDEDEKIKDENDEDDHQVDLDTRLKMLMKGKAGAAMPSFLLDELNGSEKDESEEEIKDIVSKSGNDHLVPELPPSFNPDPILSRPPSPFLSESHYQKCHDAWQNDKREKFNKLHNIENSKASPKSDDRMSLSSLSSGENNILQQGPLPNYYGYYPPPPGYDHQSWYTQQYMQQPGSGAEISSQWPLDYNVPHQQQHHHHQHYYQNQNNAIWQDPYHSIRESLKSGKSDKNVFRPVIKEAVRVVVQDLTQTLTKDINKRMCETLGFYLLDKWWAEQEQKYKEKHSNVPSSSTAAKSKSSSSTKPLESSSKVIPDTSDKVPKITRVEDISSFFDKQRESMETGAGLLKSGGFSGLGFRGSIPKMPSFKKKVPTESSKSNNKNSAKKSAADSSDDGNKDKKKKISDKRREQEKRRQERLKKSDNDHHHKSKSKETKETVKAVTTSDKSKTKTLSSIYSTLYSDTDESKDTELSDLNNDKKVDKVSSDNEKKFKKKKRSSPTTMSKSRKKRASSVSFDDTSSSSSDESESEVSESPPEENVKKKAVKKSKSKIESIDESSQGSQESVQKTNVNLSEDSSSASKGSSKSASSSSGSSSSSSGSSSDDDDEEIEEEEKKPSVKPLRRASETLHKNDPTKVAIEPLEPSTPSHIAEDHCYALTPEVEDRSPANNFENQFANDHGYTRPRTPPSKSVLKPQQHQPASVLKKLEKPKVKPKPIVAPKRTYKERSSREEFDIVYKFLTKGIDLEDIKYFKVAYNLMLERQDAANNMSKMLNYTHWVDHTVTDIPGTPPKKKRKFNDWSTPHLSGSARSEGYYKMDPREKARTKYHLQRDTNAAESSGIVNTQGAATKAKIQSAQNMSREARSNQRRQLAVLGDEASSSDLLKFNQLKFRRKNMTFGKSAIHDWGLFAKEYIGADEMVIEYVGQVVRPVISDVREKRYEKQGIGSSYLFRIDADYVVDATKCGNLARFINHSCDPNCYAKIITIDGESKIVIYSKQPIAYGEEITYDYKFPIEDEKIRCLCGTEKCRKYLN